MDCEAIRMKLLILGGDGQVGWELRRSLSILGEVVAFGRSDIDFAHPDAMAKIILTIQPNVIVNAAAYTAVDRAEAEPDLARVVNAHAVEVLARLAARLGAWLVQYSTDYVFDGTGDRPFKETDIPNPLNIYGVTKREGELAIESSQCKHLIFRTSWVYSSRGSNFLRTMMQLGLERKVLRVVADQVGAPTGADLIADVTAQALHRLSSTNDLSLGGIYHLTAAGETSWYDYARYIVEQVVNTGFASHEAIAKIEPITSDEYPTPARRPLNSRLDTGKLKQHFGVELPNWRSGVYRSIVELTGKK
jgi:dTDP-4-dehydrorhamnose reductase